jgi:hypothetical protein
MFTLSFRTRRSNAFAHGFMKGLASPAMLFRHVEIQAAPRFVEIKAPSYSIAEAFAGDWARIGADMTKVIERHGEATSQAAK